MRKTNVLTAIAMLATCMGLQPIEAQSTGAARTAAPVMLPDAYEVIVSKGSGTDGTTTRNDELFRATIPLGTYVSVRGRTGTLWYVTAGISETGEPNVNVREGRGPDAPIVIDPRDPSTSVSRKDGRGRTMRTILVRPRSFL